MNTYTTKPLEKLTAETAAELRVLPTLCHVLPDKPSGYIHPYLSTTITILGEERELSGDLLVSRSNYILSEEQKTAYKLAMFNPEYADLDYEQKLSKREEFTSKITKLEKELRAVCAEDKASIKYIDSLEGMLMCEASTFLMKLEVKITKKANPKTSVQYTALMELRKQKVITCEV